MKRIGPVAQAWYKWKALRLPWRKRFFVGTSRIYHHPTIAAAAAAANED